MNVRYRVHYPLEGIKCSYPLKGILVPQERIALSRPWAPDFEFGASAVPPQGHSFRNKRNSIETTVCKRSGFGIREMVRPVGFEPTLSRILSSRPLPWLGYERMFGGPPVESNDSSSSFLESL